MSDQTVILENIRKPGLGRSKGSWAFHIVAGTFEEKFLCFKDNSLLASRDPSGTPFLPVLQLRNKTQRKN